MSMRIRVQTKARKHSPSQPTKYTVEVERNQFIQIFVEGEMVKQFTIGDEAEYGNYNLIYTGEITKITDKTVQITAYPGSMNERRHNLSLYEFCWRNENFNAERVREHNANEMYYI